MYVGGRSEKIDLLVAKHCCKGEQWDWLTFAIWKGKSRFSTHPLEKLHLYSTRRRSQRKKGKEGKEEGRRK